MRASHVIGVWDSDADETRAEVAHLIVHGFEISKCFVGWSIRQVIGASENDHLSIVFPFLETS